MITRSSYIGNWGSKGHVQSAAMVGLHVMHGLGTDRNLTVAIEILSEIGDELNPWMKQELARAYSQDEDRKEATKWFQKAAEEGRAETGDESQQISSV